MAELTIDYPNFKLSDFINALKDRARDEDWSFIKDAEDISLNKFTIAATRHGDIVVITGVHEIDVDINRLKIYIMPDLKAIKATMTALDVSTKVLTAIGVLASGGIGFAVAAGKFAFTKIMDFSKKKRLEGYWKELLQKVINEDLEYKGLIIEDFIIGFPHIADEDRILWHFTYKHYLDLLEMKLRRKLRNQFILDSKLSSPEEKKKKTKSNKEEIVDVIVQRDKTFRDGIVDIYVAGLFNNITQVIFVITNRKPNATPFTSSEITSILNGADAFAHHKFAYRNKPIQTICIFISATDPPFENDLVYFFDDNYYVLGNTINKVPLVFIVPPIERKTKAPAAGFLGIISKSIDFVKGIRAENRIWHNVYTPKGINALLSQISLPKIIKLPLPQDDVLKHKYGEAVTPQQYIDWVEAFLFDWEDTLSPFNAKDYLKPEYFYQNKQQVYTDIA